jgi:hypothetical protein
MPKGRGFSEAAEKKYSLPSFGFQVLMHGRVFYFCLKSSIFFKVDVLLTTREKTF